MFVEQTHREVERLQFVALEFHGGKAVKKPRSHEEREHGPRRPVAGRSIHR